jgi:hypothetical protein
MWEFTNAGARVPVVPENVRSEKKGEYGAPSFAVQKKITNLGENILDSPTGF